MNGLSRVSGVAALSVLTCLILGMVLHGQITGGSIRGVVSDESGGVIPGVSVTLRNTQMGMTRAVVTDDQGSYHARALPVGEYELLAELSGFRSERRSGVHLTLGRDATVNFTLRLGEISEQVTVTGEAPLVESSSAMLGGLVGEKKVRDLPLNARSFIELVTLQAGAAFSDSGRANANAGLGKKLSIGGRFVSNSFLLDGADTNDLTGTVGSAAGGVLGVETVREFTVLTSAYDAEYGKHTGGVINAVTKSGTNEFHGSIFEFLRNDNLDARNFFDRDPARPTVRSNPKEFKRNQFGFAAGGPIVRNKTFFFGSYEGLRERLGITQTLPVPSRDMRNGLLPNPTTGRLEPVPIHPNVVPYLRSYPEPNGRDFGDGRAQHIRGISQPTDEDYYSGRIDHVLSSSTSLFGRHTFDDAQLVTTPSANMQEGLTTRNQNLAVELSRIFSPIWLNKFQFAFNRTNLLATQSVFPGLSLPKQSFTDTGVIGGIAVEGLSGWGGASPRVHVLNTFQYKDDLFYTRGKHSLKLGGMFHRLQANIKSTRAAGGSFDFDSRRNFLLNSPNRLQVNVPGSNDQRGWRQNLAGFYVQDDYKIGSTVTLNLGLRYEFITPPSEVNGLIANLRTPWDPNATVANVTLGEPYFKNPSLKNVEPRLGLAWDPFGDGKTAVRMGAGLFHEQILPWVYQVSGVRMPPLFSIADLFREEGAIDFPDAYFTQRNRFAGFVGNPQPDGMEFEPEQPTAYKYSLNLQRQLGPSLTVDLGYAGSRSTHLMRIYSYNGAKATVLPDGRLFFERNAPLINPNFGRMRWRNMDVTADYHSLRVSVNKVYSRRHQFQISYTLSKSTDDSSVFVGSLNWDSEPGDPLYLGMKQHGLSSFDVRHNFFANFTYELPGGQLAGGKGLLLGGWVTNGILRLNSGSPATLHSGSNPSYMRFVEDPPDLLPGRSNSPIRPRNPNQYFDPTAFAPPTPGFTGNLGRNTLIGPGVATFDFSLFKNSNLVSVREGTQVQFRAEFFNLFNRGNFGLPNLTIFDRSLRTRPDAGLITRTTTSSRQIQFGLKFLF